MKITRGSKSTGKRNQDFSQSENQQEVIDYNVPNNYLLYAVLYFGKTIFEFEAAKYLDAKLTVVVSAKADVKS